MALAPFRVEGSRVTFRLAVKPRSSQDRLRVDSTGGLRLEIREAPVDGEANAAIIRFLSRQLKVSRNSVEIAMGGKSHQKLIRIVGHPPYVITDRLMDLAHQAAPGRRAKNKAEELTPPSSPRPPHPA